MASMELAPFRNVDDFLLEVARFQVPDIKDLSRWSNRISNNLLYYQTNYFVTVLIVFTIAGVCHPAEMGLGLTVIIGLFVGFAFVSNNKPQLRSLKRSHPAICFFVVFAAGYLLIHVLGSVLTFLFGIALPLLLILIHASLRIRNLKNKIANKAEYVGVKRTPMGFLLENLGLEEEISS